MINQLTNQGYVILKKNLSEEQLELIREELNVKPESNSYSDESEPFPVYTETVDKIIVPRYYGTKRFGKPKDMIKITENNKVDFEFNGQLRETQPQVAECALKKIKNQGGGLLQLHTGYGKTTLALYLAAQLKLKTLIIVHKTFLQDQWYDRIRQFTTASIGMIRQKKVDVENRDIVIGMLQSISMIEYDPKIFEDFSLVIVDEAHKCASRVFSRALKKICPKYTIALSATPIRNDGLTKVINWFLGDILVKAERTGDNAVYIKEFDYRCNNKLFAEKLRWIKGSNKPDTVRMITNMHKIDQRNKFIINILDSLLLKENRKILVLSGRIEHLKILRNLLDQKIMDKVNANLCGKDEFTTSYYIGGMKDYELKEAALADVIFATYDMAAEGLDIDGLNTLVLATPKKNIIQSIGRIMRKPIKEGDINPLVIDIKDNLSCFESWGIQRDKYYKTKKYTIDNYKCHNDKVIPFKDFMLSCGMIGIDSYNNLDLDIRKEYIIQTLGENSYKFESKCKFYNFPDKMFNYSCNLYEILEINHDYSKDVIEKKTEIDFNPTPIFVETPKKN